MMDGGMTAEQWQRLRQWCLSLLGPFQEAATAASIHGRSGLWQLQRHDRRFFLKVYQDNAAWEREVHAYEQWTPALGNDTPRLLGAYEPHQGVEQPAILLTGLAGLPLRDAQLASSPEQAVWRRAGVTLRRLHDSWQEEGGPFFGPCGRFGEPAGNAPEDPGAFVSAGVERLLKQALDQGYLAADEILTVWGALGLLDCFDGERPRPCHRDYGPDNWLVDDAGNWAGVIDYEMSQWDLPMNDFSRYPHWEWLQRPELLQALYEGYGRTLSTAEKQQCYVLRVQYALDAVVWGMQAQFYGFADEGHRALAALAQGELPDLQWSLEHRH